MEASRRTSIGKEFDADVYIAKRANVAKIVAAPCHKIRRAKGESRYLTTPSRARLLRRYHSLKLEPGDDLALPRQTGHRSGVDESITSGGSAIGVVVIHSGLRGLWIRGGRIVEVCAMKMLVNSARTVTFIASRIRKIRPKDRFSRGRRCWRKSP